MSVLGCDEHSGVQGTGVTVSTGGVSCGGVSAAAESVVCCVFRMVKQQSGALRTRGVRPAVIKVRHTTLDVFHMLINTWHVSK